ncbi:MAG: hypothetical protein ACRCTD_05370 [Beijerinckiaceae bacterium]
MIADPDVRCVGVAAKAIIALEHRYVMCLRQQPRSGKPCNARADNRDPHAPAGWSHSVMHDVSAGISDSYVLISDSDSDWLLAQRCWQFQEIGALSLLSAVTGSKNCERDLH